MLRSLFALILGLYLFIIGLVTFVGLNSIQQSHESARNNIALCALRDSQDQNIKERRNSIRTSEHLLKHPEELGSINPKLVRTSLAVLQAQLKQQIRSRAALDVLHCE
jgi:hypothetical protein